MWEKQSSPKTWVEIEAAALRHNFDVFQKLAGKSAGRRTRVMAVVKANAYGHGIAEVASILASSFQLPASSLWFGVDSIDEALTIRGLGAKNPILILGYIPPERLREVIENDISFSVYSKELIKMNVGKQWRGKPRIHLKIETGTNRLGMRFEELEQIMLLVKKHSDWIEGVYTHFADTENPRSSFWKEQVARFEEAVAFLKQAGANPIKHTASSAAALLYPETRYDMIRAGIGLYGLWPSREVSFQLPARLPVGQASSFQLKPVLTWKTKIAQIKKVRKGETISYDRTFLVKRPAKIAILPIGYWDGYDRHLSNNGDVLIQGKRAPVAGRVCMNMMMVDITNIKNASEGDEAVLLGAQKKERISAEELAEKIGTINYEVVARINPLIPRVLYQYQ